VCCEAVLRLPSPPIDPGPEALTRHVALDPVPASVSVARSFVRDILGDVDPDQQDTALLLASELVTNAILHARTPVELGIVLDGATALVCVADRLAGGGPLTPRNHSQSRSGGRGLALVEDLSDRWGTESHTGGKTVWFTLSVSVGSVRAG
jgi:anti-sigma regulatory factor (Ser/Thr protein kinase)